MKKSFKTTAVLGGVLFILVLWYVVYEKNLKPKREEAKEKSKQIVSIERGDVQEMEIDILQNAEAALREKDPEAPKYATYKLKKLEKDWLLTAPLEDEADASTVTSLLSTLTTTKHEREITDGKDLAAYGLNNPRVRVRIRRSSNDAFEEVAIGNDTPVGFSAYVIPAGDKDSVYRVARSLKNSFEEKTLKDFRKKEVLSIARDEVEEAEITNQYGTFLLKATDKNAWTLARKNIPAAKDKVTKTLGAITDMRAADFVSESGTGLAAYGLTSPFARVTLKKKNETKSQTVLIGKKGDKVYAKRQDKPTVYEVNKKVIDEVGRPAKEYRSTALAEFNRFSIRRVRLERGKDVIDLLKEDEKWKFPAEPDVAVDKNKVEELIARVQDTKITRYADAKTPNTGLSAPRLALTLSEVDGTGTNVVLRFGTVTGKQVYAEREGLPTPFLIGTDDFAKLDLRKDAFVQKPEKKTEKGEAEAKPEEKKS